MAITFPLSASLFADTLRISSVKWRLQRNDEITGLGNGQILATELAPPLWTAEVAIDIQRQADADTVQAIIDTLDGSINSFYLYAPQRPGPLYDMDGSILASNTPTIHDIGVNNKSLQLTGLPAGYVITVGDFLAFDYGGSPPTRRALHRAAETVTANGSGITTAFEVRPHFQPGIEDGMAITLIKPAAECVMIPGTYDPGTAQTVVTGGMTFQAIQRL